MIVTEQPKAKSAQNGRKCKATLAIHGGAGGTLPPYLPPAMEEAYRAALRHSLIKGYAVLSKGGSALEAVCRSVQEMEDDPLFNAARGAVFTSSGTNECEASVMAAFSPKGAKLTQASLQRNRRCASAILIRETRNPILLAKALLENAKDNPHVVLSGSTAEEIGWKMGCEKVDSSYYYTRRRWLEHRRALNLPEDDDPARCQDLGEERIDPPPSYYAHSETGGTPSLDASSCNDEKITEESSTMTGPATPCTQSEELDLGMQRFTYFNVDFDTRRSIDDRVQGQEVPQGDSESWRSASFEEIAYSGRPHPIQSSDLRRYRFSETSDFLPAGTVGAVALDEDGNLAVATSTGGVTNKLPGRVGDTPTPGAGFWSEFWRVDSAPSPFRTLKTNSNENECSRRKRRTCTDSCDWFRSLFGCPPQEQEDEEDAIEQAANVTTEKRTLSHACRGVAVSGTGTGDYFLRSSFASLLVHRMRFLGEAVDVAGRKAVAEMGELGGVGGAICIDDGGRVAFPMNSATMNRGYITEGIPPCVAIFSDEECR